MELIVINGELYRCKNGTNARLRELSNAIPHKYNAEHEHGTAGDEFNAALEEITSTTIGKYIENVYTSY